ncbi:TonB-dependent receptor [Lentibacter algarum]|uniref:TonB-dependent receptor plug domain-containing protein n=1 Tax=Lentibacter algarum TaxID=576131 RepID=UPI001C07DDAB|nr:TonB-dependent receptor [Lentibacter algarum]MBU2980702.1 TonB-dependent receptor [Lentibacter algarum]
MTRHLMASLLASTAILAPPAFAQDAAFDLDPIIVESSSLTPVEQARTGTNVEVLEGEDAGSNDTRVIDRLSRLPGVNVNSNGGLGGASSIQLRGLPSRYVGVRVNGIDVADPTGPQNQFDFGGFTAAGIERVEVLKGSQSAIFGSEAIAGVVNFSTFRPTELGFSGNMKAEAGSFDTYSGALNIGHKTEQGFVALSYGHIKSQGISSQSFNTEKDGFEQSTLHLTAEYAISDTVTIGGAFLYRDGEGEFDRSSFSLDSTGEFFNLEHGARVYTTFETGAVTHTLSFSYFDIDRKDPGGFTPRFQGKRQSVAYLGSASLGANATLNFGIDHTEEKINAGAAVGSEDNTSFTAELLFSPGAQFDLSAALRYDDNSTFGGQATGRLSAVYHAREDLALRASVGSGYRAPSLYERFSAYGDPALQPEKSVSYELGVEKTYGTRGFVKATLFLTDIDDLIDYDFAATVCGSGFGCYNQVPGKTTSKGLELSGEYKMSERYSFYGAYTYTDAKTEGVRLARTPRHDLVLGVNGTFTDRFSGYLNVRHAADVLPSAFASAGNKVGDYTLVGAGLSYDLSDTAEVFLRVDNLLDEDYETASGYNQPGRSVFVGLRADF